MSQTFLLIAKALLGSGAALVVLYRHRFKLWGPRLLLFFAVLAGLAYFNFGAFHPGRGVIHYHEQFHYLLGAKYFPELGYDGLYAASLKAEAEGKGTKSTGKVIRDLRSNRKILRKNTTGHQEEVKRRFSTQRWQAFSADHAFLSQQFAPAQISVLHLDHGYNATPAWTAFAGALLQVLGPLGPAKVYALALLDPLLLLLLFFVLWRSFGSESMGLCLMVFGFAFLSRFDWTGGSFLRHDWLVALVTGLCMLKRERFFSAGLLIGLATVMRVFPILLLVGPLAIAVRQILRREPKGWLGPFGLGLTLTIAIGVLLGAFSGRGWFAWQEFFNNIQIHRETWSANNVGFENMLVHAYDLGSRPLSTWFQFRGNADWLASAHSLSTTVPYLRPVAIALWIGLVALASVNKSPFEAALVGIVAIFAALSLSCYYYAFLFVVPLARSRRLTASILVLGAVSGLLSLTQVRLAIYGIDSWLLCVVFGIWIVPQALRGLRRRV